ncbi:MAG: L-type lectin-domain containing protein [Planctomycetota bacterium]
MLVRRHKLSGIAVAVVCFSGSLVHADFDYPTFPSASDFGLVGSANVANGDLVITPAAVSQAGAAWFAQAQEVDGGFMTDFALQMSPQGQGADGMAFVIQSVGPNAIGCLGGNPCGSSTVQMGSLLAYEGLPSVAVEFDTYDAGMQNDPNDNHISVHSLGMNPNDVDEALASLGSTATPGVDLNNGVVHNIRITYNPGSMRIYVNNLMTPVLTVVLDLEALLGPGPKWCGFTGATGGLFQTHIVQSWSFVGSSVAEEFVRGDCNNDGSRNLPDVIFLLGFLFPQGAPPTLTCRDACDNNDDGSINLPDVITQLNALFGMPPVPLPPPAACGADPTTGDTFDCPTFPSCP